MLFITNRFPKEALHSQAGRSWSFDLDNNTPTTSLFFCERNSKENYTEIMSKAFLEKIRNTRHDQILIYIHGFSNLPEPSIFPASRKLQKFFDQKHKDDGADRVLVIPLIWPCDNDASEVDNLIGKAKEKIVDYFDDQQSADQSGHSFARALQKFLAWRDDPDNELTNKPCLKRINILAHSMGNRVLRETIRIWSDDHLNHTAPLLFRNTFMVAADVVNEALHPDQTGVHITHASRNVVVYFASDDLALRASKAANLNNKIASRRLGHTGPEDIHITPKNVYSVDCDDINTIYDFPSGHGYFLDGTLKGTPGLVFNHIANTIDVGRVFPDEESRRSIILKD